MKASEIHDILVKIEEVDRSLSVLQRFETVLLSQPNLRFINVLILRYYELHKERHDVKLSLFGDAEWYHSISEEKFEYDESCKQVFLDVVGLVRAYLLNKKAQLESLLSDICRDEGESVDIPDVSSGGGVNLPDISPVEGGLDDIRGGNNGG